MDRNENPDFRHEVFLRLARTMSGGYKEREEYLNGVFLDDDEVVEVRRMVPRIRMPVWDKIPANSINFRGIDKGLEEGDYFITIPLELFIKIEVLGKKLDKLSFLLEGLNGLEIDSEPDELTRARLNAITSSCKMAREQVKATHVLYLEMTEARKRREISIEHGIVISGSSAIW